MIRFFSARKSIQHKLLAIFIFILACVVSITMAVSILNSMNNYRKMEGLFIESFSNTLTENLKSSLLFLHQESAQALLDSLQANKTIKLALLLDSEGTTFASYGEPQAVEQLARDYKLLGRSVTDVAPGTYANAIQDSGQLVGELILVPDTSLMTGIIWRDIEFNLYVFVIALLLSFVATRILAKHVTKPILQLSEFMIAITATNDYTKRLSTNREDEFRQLFDNVNQLVQHADGWTEELKEMNKAKSLFLANMSHEIRTPVNGILGLSEVLSETQLNARQAHLLQSIRESGKLLLAVINDILDISKIEAGNFQLDPQPVNLRQSIEASVRYFNELCAKKGIHFVLDLPIYEKESFVIDDIRLNQVIFNLLSNAYKFTETGYIKLSWQIRYQVGTAQIEVKVKDTGVGINEAKLKKIFEAFEQADVSTSRKFGGTGLGLSICKSIVEFMKGELDVVSREGFGTEFSVKVEVALANLATHGYQSKGFFKQLRIALVSSDAMRNKAISQKMAYWGADVREFLSEGELQSHLADIQSSDIDLVWRDCSHPSQSTYQWAQQIKESYSVTPILESFDESTDEIGFDYSVPKPVYTASMFSILCGFRKGTLQESQIQQQSSVNEYPNLSHLRVLLAEDNETNQELARSIFDLVQCRFAIANNGQEALELFRQQPFDLVLMDCQMPLMDGYDATRAIREIEGDSQRQPTPILALTAHIQAEEREKCLNCGMDDYLSKPYQIGQLVDKIVELTGSEIKVVPSKSTPVAQAEQQPSDSVINPKIFNNLVELERQGVPNVVKRVIEKFLPESEVAMKAITNDFQRGDLEQLQRAAHKYKSLAASIGGDAVSNLCKEIEYGENQGEDELAQLIKDLTHHHYELRDEVVILSKKY